ncbi:MAG: prepilin-type N-terminal cleavage/methylation domain-containing protein [Nitrosomonadales bacterium]
MKQLGFSLVELSIVLLIIGLLLTGIMNSQGVIGSTQTNDVIAIIDDLTTSTAYFKQHYSYLPGDLPSPATDINSTPVLVEGTGGTIGNGVIDGAINDTPGDLNRGAATISSDEVAQAPLQLYKAGLLGKIQTDLLRRVMTKYGPVHLVSAATANGLVVNFTHANANASSRNAIVFFNIPCDTVTAVDNKIDNGMTVYDSVDPVTGVHTYGGRAFGTGCNNNVVTWYAVAL